MGSAGAGEASMLVTTELGCRPAGRGRAPTALRPDHPEYLKAVPPPDPRGLRSGVGSDPSQLFLLLAGICRVIVAVLERTGEIGLRRALGARARHITAQFLAESGTLGALGGNSFLQPFLFAPLTPQAPPFNVTHHSEHVSTFSNWRRDLESRRAADAGPQRRTDRRSAGQLGALAPDSSNVPG